MHSNPIILSIETATDICSIAFSRGKTILSLKESEQPYQHTSQITILIQEALEEAKLSMSDIKAVAISSGPGSYTALRVGTSTAKGICYALDLPLISVSTLQSLAYASWLQEKEKAFYCPMIDARRMEVYLALYNEQHEEIKEPESVIIGESLFSAYFLKGEKIFFSGNGALKAKEILTSPYAHFLSIECSALHLIPLALEAYEKKWFVDLAYYEPIYLKPPNITTPKKIL